MHEDSTGNVLGAVTGGALAAVYHWSRNEDDTQQRLRAAQGDVNTLLAWVRQYTYRGEVQRSRLPVVQDFQAGLSAATAQQPAPTLIPTATAPTRPNLAAGMEAQVGGMQWPPLAGSYDSEGMVQGVGEMGVLAESLTFPEVRACLQGFVQPNAPSAAGLQQMWRMMNALAYQAALQGLTWQQYQQIWARLFGGALGVSQGPNLTANVHADPTRPPTATAQAALSIVPLSSQSISGYPYANRNTDIAMKYRITVATTQAPFTALAGVTYGTPYQTLDANGAAVPYQPNVQVSLLTQQLVNNTLVAQNITHAGFTLYNNTALNAGSYDVQITTLSGISG